MQKVEPIETKDAGLITLYHGSQNVIKRPVFGFGNKNNDYGLGFYTTQYKDLAGEWAVLTHEKDGYINEYSFDMQGLKILNLEKEPIETWIAILLKNREMSNLEILRATRDAFVKKYDIDTSPYDVIIGWRADDNYMRYVEDFLIRLPIDFLEKALRLGDLGIQYCLKTELAFSRLVFTNKYEASMNEYYIAAKGRDDLAKDSYDKLTMELPLGGRTIDKILEEV